MVLVSSFALIACGSSHSRDRDAGVVDRDGGTTRDAGRDAATVRDSGPRDSGVPPACAVESSAPPPYRTIFQLINTGSEDIWLLEECRLRFTVSACASGYEPVALWADCTLDCGDPTSGCIACGPCMQNAIRVAPSEAYEVTWDGITYTFSTTAEGCTCSTGHPAPAARYRVSVPVFASPDAALASVPARTVDFDFDLPVAFDGVVTVPL